ncbi:DUF6660 family protein [Pedobacter sp. SYSU D00535]|uniref:DUF6660 family protein n=1 Tax=Pedobacter sp. SYSU D00535 TaxID=2810308 RepID=UPI00351BEA5D
MKVLALFMTVIMLFTGFDLCKDEESCGSKKQVELSRTQDEHPQDSDLCSPFCNCTRCPFSVLLPQGLGALQSFHTLVPQYQKERSANPIRVSPSVWQPPKLA